jgi:hypothetical protein
MALRIPEEDIPALAVIKALPEASARALADALKSAKPSPDTSEMAARISKKVPSIPMEQLSSILDALYTIYYIRELSGVEPSTFLEDFMEGVQNVPQLKAGKQGMARLRGRFEQLLSTNSFNLLSKAKRLQRDGERLYCDAKILSDIRPVFNRNPTSRPLGAVVTHTLRLGYHESGDHKEFRVILDSVDLDVLADVVFRAKAKDETLRELLKDAKLPDLGL